VVTEPRALEIIAWPDTLPLTERLVILHAMAIAFPPLQRRPDWKSRIEAAHAALSPNAEELGDILKAASRRAEQMKADGLGNV
jgi:hypothetical protein